MDIYDFSILYYYILHFSSNKYAREYTHDTALVMIIYYTYVRLPTYTITQTKTVVT